MTKKNIMTGIGINMAAISTDSTFPLGENYCVDIDKECKDLGAVSDLPEYDRGSSSASTTTSEILFKKFLITPEWMETNNSLESLYVQKTSMFASSYQYWSSVYKTASAYFPESEDQSYREGWDSFGKDTTLEYIPIEDPPLEILTQQEDIPSGYRDKVYNFLFQCNQYAYNLTWSLVNPTPGCIMSSGGYFSLSETGEKNSRYTFTVKVHNPDTDETVTKDFTLDIMKETYIPATSPETLSLTGPSEITIFPHRNFKATYKAKGGTPPYRFAVDSPLENQWPFQNTLRHTIHGKDYLEDVQFNVESSSLDNYANINANKVEKFTLSREIVFEKIPFKKDPNDVPEPPDPPIELAALPEGLVFDTHYYCMPIMENNLWTGKVQFASSYQNAIDGIFIPFTAPGAGAPSQTFFYYFPDSPDLSYTNFRSSPVYLKTVNRYIDQVSISIAIPPLPKHWGHGNRYDTHVKLEEGDPWSKAYTPSALIFTHEDHYKSLKYTYDETTQEYTWAESTNIYAWISDDPADVKEIPFLEYNTSTISMGQYLPALGFEEYLTLSTNKNPFDPWRFQDLTKTATNYMDVTVIDSKNKTYTIRVTIAEPEYDFSETCGVPYWKGTLNYYTCDTPTPMTTEPRTEGRIITTDTDTESETYGKQIVVDYDPENPDEAPNNQLSKTVPTLDNLDKYTFEMTHYYPASRFTQYDAVTKYNIVYETTYWPYEKFHLPFLEMSIHPNHAFSYPPNPMHYRKS